MIYGGNPNLIHVDDGKRAAMGERFAQFIDTMMRQEYQGERTLMERMEQKLCPGCYMIVLFNALLTLASNNNQSRTELARSMRNAFDQLLSDPAAGLTEEMEILLDPCEV